MASDQTLESSVEISRDCDCPICRADAVDEAAHELAVIAGDDLPNAATYTCLMAAARRFDNLANWQIVCAVVFARLEAIRATANNRTVH